MTEPRWITLARAEIGTLELPGTRDNPKIIEYARDGGVLDIVSHDVTPWCAAFVGGMLHRAGIQGSGKATAVSYQNWGKRLITPCLGAVIWFKPMLGVTGTGHVAFYLGMPDPAHIRVLGGNQHDSVCEADFSIGRIGAIRWPVTDNIEPEWVGPLPVTGAAQTEPSDR